MKFISAIIAISLTGSLAQALVCGSWARAVNTDQKKMVGAVAFNPHALGLAPRQVYSLKISDYVSWKGEQLACAADIFHRAQLEIVSLTPKFDLCTDTLTLHRKDDFVTGNATANYKIENKVRSCVKPDVDQMKVINRCLETVCEYIGDSPTYPDYTDGCRCKLLDDLIQFQNEQSKYENFYEPDVLFPKPEGLSTPFQ